MVLFDQPNILVPKANIIQALNVFDCFAVARAASCVADEADPGVAVPPAAAASQVCPWKTGGAPLFSASSSVLRLVPVPLLAYPELPLEEATPSAAVISDVLPVLGVNAKRSHLMKALKIMTIDDVIQDDLSYHVIADLITCKT